MERKSPPPGSDCLLHVVFVVAAESNFQLNFAPPRFCILPDVSRMEKLLTIFNGSGSALRPLAFESGGKPSDLGVCGFQPKSRSTPGGGGGVHPKKKRAT